MQNMRIETEKGHEIVSRLILERIENGHWEPGCKLPSVVDLSLSFGVGRSTVREALSALKAMGWLDIRHGGGTFVKKILPSASSTSSSSSFFQEASSILELLEVRKVIEAGTSALAAERRSEEDLEKLRAILDKMEQSLLTNDTAQGERADVAFHAAIAAASKNSLLIGLMDSLSQRFSDSIGKTRELWFYQEKANALRLLEEHRSIFNAIEQMNVAQSTELISLHLTKVESELKAIIKKDQ
ncbi:FadR family transcriptional regulator [Paenibacillus sp. GSMTC-2017]|uniref:FadR/GntR family transcriptional regulator n=1 Tax=Paenibacillus sp. GSMTC-2017 TaxID=2794350 RepID=UPI0018D6663E|nr:FadR/GntR family transcriptional regulator [Paenibacillus sp. GSMTC-2017]MBH5318282.1 FadR family transcriptional regulator [Paenibacillus sp. GSMTC-2017]